MYEVTSLGEKMYRKKKKKNLDHICRRQTIFTFYSIKNDGFSTHGCVWWTAPIPQHAVSLMPQVSGTRLRSSTYPQPSAPSLRQSLLWQIPQVIKAGWKSGSICPRRIKLCVLWLWPVFCLPRLLRAELRSWQWIETVKERKTHHPLLCI